MAYEFDVLRQLLLQGREYGFGVILASQYLTHFRTSKENYGEPLLTWFIHKVPNVTANQLTSLGLTGVSAPDAQRISVLGIHEALYSSLGYPATFMRGTPFYRLVSDEVTEEGEQG